MTDHNESPKYPNVEVQLSGEDGNAFAILGRVQSALRAAGASKAELEEFFDTATDGDYNHLLRTCMAWVTVQ